MCQAFGSPVSLQWRTFTTCLSLVNDHSPANLRIAVVRFSALGDVVMVSAAVRALQLSFPAATITWITSPFAYALLKGMDGVNFEVFDKPRTFADYRAFYRTFRSRRFDVVSCDAGQFAH